MSFSPDALIFDFDGVIVDSEWIANEVLAEVLTANGMPTSVDDSYDWYMGRQWADNVLAIEERWGTPPVDLRDQVRAIHGNGNPMKTLFIVTGAFLAFFALVSVFVWWLSGVAVGMAVAGIPVSR